MLNCELRSALIKNSNFDIICLCETHLKHDNVSTVDNYIWIGNNRKYVHVNARKGSGGVGFLIKNDILIMYAIKQVDRSVDGVIKLVLSHRHSDCIVVLFGAYIPPENSTRGRTSDVIFSYLSTQIYLDISDADVILLLGDLNARIGKLNDCIEHVDREIVKRVEIDDVKNSQGEEFIEFLQEMNMCVLNGRFHDDNFTCISSKGRSVVDYICVMQCQFDMYLDFKVCTVTDMLSQMLLEQMISDQCRPPDHSIIEVKVRVSPGDALCPTVSLGSTIEQNNNSSARSRVRPDNFRISENNMSARLNSRMNVNINKPSKIYNVPDIPEQFMTNPAWRDEINIIIDKLQSRCDTQNEVDILYNTMCATVYNEMDRFLDYKQYSGNNSGKRLKFHKPYWNENLTSLWKEMTTKEHIYLKVKGSSRDKSVKRIAFVNARARFDRQLRICQRQYRKQEISDIEKVCTHNPREFWKYIKRLGPRKKQVIPDVVRTSSGLSRDPQIILDEWKTSFEKLYNRPEQETDNIFYDNAREYIRRHETNFDNTLYSDSENNILNSGITYDETVNIIRNLKSKRRRGSILFQTKF